MTINDVTVEDHTVELNDHYCPNCWGYQDYDNVICDAVEDHQIDVQNQRAVKSFILKWVEEHLDGIKLKERKCTTCGHDVDAEEEPNVTIH